MANNIQVHKREHRPNLKSGAGTWLKGFIDLFQGEERRVIRGVMKQRAAKIDEHRRMLQLSSDEPIPVSDQWLIDEWAFKTAYLRLIDHWCMKEGPLDKVELKEGRVKLQSALSNSYLAFSNSARRDLEALHAGKERAVRQDHIEIVRRYCEEAGEK